MTQLARKIREGDTRALSRLATGVENRDPQALETLRELAPATGHARIVGITGPPGGVGQDEIEIASVAQVTVVVLIPGMGDDVQAIKAGIMEIADIFVVNKSDHPGADRVELELHTEGFNCPILHTVATEGKGIPELAAALDSIPTGGAGASACQPPPDQSTDHPPSIDSIR